MHQDGLCLGKSGDLLYTVFVSMCAPAMLLPPSSTNYPDSSGSVIYGSQGPGFGYGTGEGPILVLSQFSGILDHGGGFGAAGRRRVRQKSGH